MSQSSMVSKPKSNPTPNLGAETTPNSGSKSLLSLGTDLQCERLRQARGIPIRATRGGPRPHR